MNILLNEEDFQKLTRGEVIEKDGNKICLQDIGYKRLIEILYQNFHEFIGKQ